MQTLTRAVQKTEHSGEAIPLPFRSWTTAGISFLRGDLGLIAGPPAVGKSTVALNIAVASQLPTLYFSADSSLATQALRVVSMLTQVPMSSLKDRLATDPDAWGDEWIQEALARSSHIKWNFEAQPTLKTIDEEVSIYTLIHGEPPALIVIDNAVDIAFESGDEFGSLRQLMKELKLTARDCNAAVIVLHHTSESVQSDPCPPLYALHGKVSQTPAVVVTLGAPQEGFLAACPVKNRNGGGDRHGRNAIYMSYSPEVGTVSDWTTP